MKESDLKSAIKDKNVERIKKGMEDLTKASHKLAEEIYKQARAKQGSKAEEPGADGEAKDSAQGAQAKPGNDDIIDAEYKEEDDKK